MYGFHRRGLPVPFKIGGKKEIAHGFPSFQKPTWKSLIFKNRAPSFPRIFQLSASGKAFNWDSLGLSASSFPLSSSSYPFFFPPIYSGVPGPTLDVLDQTPPKPNTGCKS